jgi:hypothetical protein
VFLSLLTRLFNEKLYVGQLNVSQSIILYLSSPEQREGMMEKERGIDKGVYSGWMDGALVSCD